MPGTKKSSVPFEFSLWKVTLSALDLVENQVCLCDWCTSEYSKPPVTNIATTAWHIS